MDALDRPRIFEDVGREQDRGRDGGVRVRRESELLEELMQVVLQDLVTREQLEERHSHCRHVMLVMGVGGFCDADFCDGYFYFGD